MASESLDETGDFLWFEALGDDTGSTEAQGLVFLFAFDAVETGDELNGREQLHIELLQNFGGLGQEVFVPGVEILHPSDDDVGHMANVRNVLGKECSGYGVEFSEFRNDRVDLGSCGTDWMISRGFSFAGVSQLGVLATVDVVVDFRGEAEFNDIIDPWLKKCAGDFPHGTVWPEEVEEYIGVEGDQRFSRCDAGEEVDGIVIQVSNDEFGIVRAASDGLPPGDEAPFKGQNFESLFEDSIKENDFKVGDVVSGVVVEVQSDYVLVDINYKSEGLIPISEFRMLDGVRDVKPGEKIEVLIDRIENENGMIVLSKDKADMLRDAP